MIIHYKKNKTAVPTTGTDYSAGYDIAAFSDPIVHGTAYVPVGFELKDIPVKERLYESITYIEYKTGLLVEPQEFIHLYIFPRSSISKYNLLLCNSVGLIDYDYRGEISFRFKYIVQPEDLVILDGKILTRVNYSKIYAIEDRIGQIVGSYTHRLEFREMDELNDTNRGTGGFGSTGTSVKNMPQSLVEDQLIRIRTKTEPTKISYEIEPGHAPSQEKVSGILKHWKEKLQSQVPQGYEQLMKEHEKQK